MRLSRTGQDLCLGIARKNVISITLYHSRAFFKGLEGQLESHFMLRNKFIFQGFLTTDLVNIFYRIE